MGRPRTWTDDDLRRAVADASTYTEVVETLRERTGACSYMSVRVRIAELGIDAEHLERARKTEAAARQQANRRGESYSNGRRPGPGRGPSDPLADDGKLTAAVARARSYRDVLVRLDLKPGGSAEWRGKPAPLRLDHINGDRHDNRLENLRAICPNCDAFTDTHCGRNIGRYDDEDGDVS